VDGDLGERDLSARSRLLFRAARARQRARAAVRCLPADARRTRRAAREREPAGRRVRMGAAAMKSVPLRALMSTIALVVALTTTICVPAGYFALGYINMARVLNFKAELSARNLARYIYTHDTLWQYERVRLAELLEEIDDSSDTTSRRIVDAAGKLVLEDGALLTGPQVSRSSPIVVAGQTVGSIAV